MAGTLREGHLTAKLMQVTPTAGAALDGSKMVRANGRWKAEHVEMLRQMISEKLPISFMSKKLCRTEQAVVSKATRIGLVLKKPGKKRAKRPR